MAARGTLAAAGPDLSSWFLIRVARDAPAIGAFLDELRARGFIEGQNLTILPGGFQVRNEQIADMVAALVKAAPQRDHERR